MTFENLAKLTNSVLLNEPYISSFERIVFDPHRVKRGDLFIGDDTEEIKIALKKEAYAILSQRQTNVLDDEIAWLKCQNTDEALIGLLRYFLMQTGLHFICFDPVESKLMQQISTKENIVFLTSDSKKNFQKIIDASENSIIIGYDKKYLQSIYPAYEIANIAINYPIKKIKSTLFLSTFGYKEQIYENIKLPEIFLKKFENILNFLDSRSIEYKIRKLDFIPYFYPIFVNADLTIKNFGMSTRALIATKDKNHAIDGLRYLQKKAPWSKYLLFLDEKAQIDECRKNITFSYSDLTEINKLKDFEFNFAIIDADSKELTDELKKIETKKEPSLFEEQ